MHGSSRCRSCGAPIIWKRTTNGKNIPLDANPRDDGNLFIDGDTAVHIHTRWLGSSGPLYVTHFATCPNAEGHRQQATA